MELKLPAILMDQKMAMKQWQTPKMEQNMVNKRLCSHYSNFPFPLRRLAVFSFKFYSILFVLAFLCVYSDRHFGHWNNLSNRNIVNNIPCVTNNIVQCTSYVTALSLPSTRAIFTNKSTTVDDLLLCRFIVINTWKTNSDVILFFHWTKNFFIFHWILFFVSLPNSTESLLNFSFKSLRKRRFTYCTIPFI